MQTATYRLVISGVLAGGLILTATLPVLAQRSSSGRGRGFDPTEIYNRMDVNKNGQIDPEEMSDRSRPFLEQAAQRAGLDPKKPIPISKLIENQGSGESSPASGAPASSGTPASAPSSSSDGDRRDRGSDRGDRSERDRGRDEPRSSSSSGGSSSKTPSVPGFGSDTKIAKAAGFDAPTPAAAAASAAFAAKYDKRVIEMLDGMMKEYDRNRDDILDDEEMKKMTWRSDPKESDTNKDGKLSRAELADRLAKRFQSERGPSSGGSSAGTPSAANPQQSEEYQRVKKYAESLLKQNDSNSNGLLEKNEWTEVKSITKDTDTNNDGIVTLDELIAKLSSFGKSSGSTSSSSGSTSGGSSSSSSPGSSGGPPSGGYSRGGSSGGPPRYGYGSQTAKSGDRKTFRALSPLERLPKGLPDWFARNDADGDGQIHMSEYTTSWSDAKAEEFAKFDLNGDGFITTVECLKVEPSKK